MGRVYFQDSSEFQQQNEKLLQDLAKRVKHSHSITGQNQNLTVLYRINLDLPLHVLFEPFPLLRLILLLITAQTRTKCSRNLHPSCSLDRAWECVDKASPLFESLAANHSSYSGHLIGAGMMDVSLYKSAVRGLVALSPLKCHVFPFLSDSSSLNTEELWPCGL